MRTAVEDVADRAHLAEIISGLTDAFYRLDAEWRLVEISQGAESLYFKRPAGELLGRVIWDVFPAFLNSEAHRLFRRAREAGCHFQGQVPSVMADRWYEAHLWPRQEGGLEVYLKDITAWKRVENVLKQREEQLTRAKEVAETRAGEAEEARRILDALMEHIPMGIAIAEASPVRVRMVSRWGRELLGHNGQGAAELSELENPEHWPIYRNETDSFTEPMAMPLPRAVKNGEVIREEIWYLGDKQGGRIPVLVTASPIRDAEGRITGGVVGWQDIRERLQTESRLKHFTEQVERSNRELEQFAHVVSHDLQEPLRMITTFLHLLEERYRDRLDNKAYEYIGFAVEGAGRMKGLIQSLLDYSRVGGQELSLEPVRVDEVLDTVLLVLRARIEECRARVSHDPLPEVVADNRQLTQVFQNLIGNALKFRGPRSPEIHVGAENQGRHWVLFVRDNGIGIDPAHSGRIFEVFQRLHAREEYEGTGVGLAICKKIIERHGGRIWVESEPGRGSTFRFTIPSRK